MKFNTIVLLASSAVSFDPQCTRSERNTFSLLGAFQLLVSSCLTLNGQQDNDSDVTACIASVVAQKLGVSQMQYGCYNCLVDGVQKINKFPLKAVRDACITDVSSDDCSQIDLSSFVECTGGYDPTQAVIEAYCTEENAIEFMKTSMYRQITSGCLDQANYVASNSATLLECIVTTMVDKSSNFNTTNLSGECVMCWYQLFSSMAILPPNQRAACVADPTSDDCVTDSLHKDMFLFHKCAGMHPVGTDIRYLADQLSNAVSITSISTITLAVVAIVTMLL